MEEILKQILNELKEIRVDINELKQGQNRLEVGQEKLQKNLVDSLGLYTDKIVDHIDDKTEVLNKRVYKVETEIERLSRQ
ncbi:hypothetical protein ACIQAA_31930 [Neobacillus sp. NPDC093182]|uniref:hypothetical protein n=1 Tax=Neobacillus sp. NPDC093182 TaxID=3364297 RepID=UPI00382A7C4D